LTRRFRVLAVVGATVAVLLVAGKLLAAGSIDPVAFLSLVGLFAFVCAIVWVTDRENIALEAKVRDRNAALERASEQLREVSVRQEAFVSHVSHELFTPLTTIVGTMNILSEPDGVPVAQVPRLAEMAARSTERMSQRVDDLMLASGLTRFVAYEKVPFDIGEEVARTLDDFDPIDKTVGVDIVNGSRAIGDAERFRTALRHILSNADRFSPAGSLIRVEGRMNGHGATVTVLDEGPGIHPDHREAVFEGFRQFDAPTRVHEGLGLGLFVAREVARGMGGDVTIEDVDRGCAVRIALPSAEKQVARFGRRSVAAAIAASLIVVSGGAMAATGKLPAPLQDAASKVAKLVGVEIPDGMEDFEDYDEEDTDVLAPVEETTGDVGPGNSGDTGNATEKVEDPVSDAGGSVGEASQPVTESANDTTGNVGDKLKETVEEPVEEDPVEKVEEEVEDLGGVVGGLVK
jgi:signal transduction histidine kinase